MKAWMEGTGIWRISNFTATAANPAGFCLARAELAEYVNTHPNLTVDVGQVMFGDTTSMTGMVPWLICSTRSAGANG
jgi:formylmethanofuran dehydrogenase subunit A